MSSDKEKVEVLTKRVDELLVILNGIMEDLRKVSGSLKSLVVGQNTQPLTATPPTPLPQPSQSVAGAPRPLDRSKVTEDIKMLFPEELENMLNFEEKEEFVMIKPRQFLGSDNFSKIASIIRGVGGEYVSAGKASHFRVPKKRA